MDSAHPRAIAHAQNLLKISARVGKKQFGMALQRRMPPKSDSLPAVQRL